MPGTFIQFQSVPCSTPGFSLCGFRLRWQLWARLPDVVGGDVVCDAQLSVMEREEVGNIPSAGTRFQWVMKNAFVPYNIKLYVALDFTRFDYRVRRIA